MCTNIIKKVRSKKNGFVKVHVNLNEILNIGLLLSQIRETNHCTVILIVTLIGPDH